jgi:uncharacterized protein
LHRFKVKSGNTGRVSPSFCWPWSNPKSDGTLQDGVFTGYYDRPWNAKPDARILAEGIPKSNLWAYDPTKKKQVGCVYTVQRFEFDYAAVIFGNDLTYNFDQQTWKGHPENSANNIVKRSKNNFHRTNQKHLQSTTITRNERMLSSS